ncbi:tellurite resistance TerB family protein [Carboxylicivirga linearis]|uniref:TerB family tellurite resistance protein n=1 Tax=Carboxylicivirga linearis TaxID=1628157 RepID=A0ABS5JUM1_9BACT|nr:hypothetical protein [Carboxylicivirga linearis]MBS2098495.1 hypothetical protein [Carboxylicivirga linearis]
MLQFSDYFDEKKCYVATLIKMANADDKLTAAENMWLGFVTVSMGVKPSELDEIKTNIDKFNFQLPSTEKDRFFLFFRVIQLMKVDLNIDEKELEMCRNLGSRLNINREKVDQVLSFVKSKEKELIQFEDVESLLK